MEFYMPKTFYWCAFDTYIIHQFLGDFKSGTSSTAAAKSPEERQ